MENQISSDFDEKKPCKVLLVEDDPSDSRLVVMALKQSKILINVHIVKNGADALAFLQAEAPFQSATLPDLVVLDLNLPGFDGREVLALMKSIDSLKDIPVIVLSTSSYEKDIEFCQKLNVTSYLVKPALFEHYENFVKHVEKICCR